jgi:hypothetical protein
MAVISVDVCFLPHPRIFSSRFGALRLNIPGEFWFDTNAFSKTERLVEGDECIITNKTKREKKKRERERERL